jgi:hypothetical protein
MKHYTTNPGAQGTFIRSLRELADYLDRNPVIPVPKSGATVLLHASSAENGGRAQVDHVATLMNAEINDDTANGGHYWAVRTFGVIGYEIVAITEQYSAASNALMSYRGSVTPDLQPDTWT